MKPPLPRAEPFRRGALFLAPMVALSHRALRELIMEFGGLDYAYTEMASAAAVVSGSPYEDCYLDPGPCPEQVVYQLYATKGERMPEALARLNGRPVFGADLNFGCAAPHITKAGGGAAWMREPEKAFALARSARAVWDSCLSAKIRLGPGEDYSRLAEFVLGLAEAGVEYIALHPRFEGQKFRRQGRWDLLARLAQEMPIPIVGNGDIRLWTDYRRRVDEAGAAGYMLGREAARRPWIFALLRGRELSEDYSIEVDLLKTALRMLELIETRLIKEFWLTRAQRFFYYYAENFSFSHHIKWRLVNAPDLATMRHELTAYFEELPSDQMHIYTV